MVRISDKSTFIWGQHPPGSRKLTLTIDLEEALKWYRKAADSGHAGAQGRLGEAYEDGDLGRATDLQVART